MKANEAKKLTEQAISAARSEEERAADEAELEKAENYQKGFDSAKYDLEKLLRNIKAAAKAGKTEVIHRSSKSDRNGDISMFKRGNFAALKGHLIDLEYDVDLSQKGEFIPDCDGYGDSYKWLSLKVSW